MKIFHCDHCDHLVFFENIRCVSCHHALAFLPDLQMIGSLEPAGDDTWRSPVAQAKQAYRLCTNYDRESVCNWAVPVDDPDPLCRSCRLTQVIPDLMRPGNKEAWYRLETAKRRLIYSLLTLGLPLVSKADDPEKGLAFEFLADTPEGPVFTGHDNGLITLNLAEADDAQREQRRRQMHEPYRTLLGHCRHEIGHYYWDLLVRDSDRVDWFRALFGDDRESYEDALKRHYETGPPDDWQQRFVSAYASSHAWEDWAETWAHYLHMSDALETAAGCGLSLKPRRPDDPSLKTDAHRGNTGSFDKMIADWFALTYVLNNLNRGLGQPDGYPFVLSMPAIEKLLFVHETIEGAQHLNSKNVRGVRG